LRISEPKYQSLWRASVTTLAAMATPRAKKKAGALPKNERRQQILSVAREAFAKRGYHQTTIDDIVVQAGVARGTFYLYFEDKRAVFSKYR